MEKAVHITNPKSITLFSDYERTDYQIKYHLEENYKFYDRVKNNDYEKIRNLLKKWFASYPDQNKQKLLSDIKAKFYHAFFELTIFSFLKEMKLQPTIEVKSAGVNLTPDFLCISNNTSFYVECTVCEGISEQVVKIQNRKKSLYDKLSKLDISDYFINIDLFELKSNKQFGIKRIIEQIQSKVNAFTDEERILIQNFNDQHPKFPRLYYEDDDVVVSFYFSYRNVKSPYDSQMPICVYPTTAKMLGIENAIPKSIEKKISKYSKISEPYFVFINYTESAFYRSDDLEWHLYGTKHWKGDENHKPIFNSNKINNLLGVVVTNLVPENLHRFKIDLYINPKFDIFHSAYSIFPINREANRFVYKDIDIRHVLQLCDDFISNDIWNLNQSTMNF